MLALRLGLSSCFLCVADIIKVGSWRCQKDKASSALPLHGLVQRAWKCHRGLQSIPVSIFLAQFKSKIKCTRSEELEVGLASSSPLLEHCVLLYIGTHPCAQIWQRGAWSPSSPYAHCQIQCMLGHKKEESLCCSRLSSAPGHNHSLALLSQTAPTAEQSIASKEVARGPTDSARLQTLGWSSES